MPKSKTSGSSTVQTGSSIISHFTYGHLPARLQGVSRVLCEAAHEIDALLPAGSAEKTAGLRKLLEARDCFVRAQIEADWANTPKNDPA